MVSRALAVYAETASAASDPRIVETVGDAIETAVIVSWHPGRGWLCSVHLPQPCIHTVDLVAAKSPVWGQ